MSKAVKLKLDDQEATDIAIGVAAPIGSATAQTDIGRLAEYSNKIATIGRGFNKMHAPLYIQDFTIAYDIASNMMFTAMREDLKADAALQEAESIAYLDNAKAYLDARDIKDTAEARKRYVPLDPQVKAAADRKAQSAAMVQFLRNKLIEFKMAIESVKKVSYGDMYLNPEEGM